MRIRYDKRLIDNIIKKEKARQFNCYTGYDTINWRRIKRDIKSDYKQMFRI